MDSILCFYLPPLFGYSYTCGWLEKLGSWRICRCRCWTLPVSLRFDFVIQCAEDLIKLLRLYVVRLGLLSYYYHRTSSAQSQLDDLQSQRDETIRKLKAATKYDTTQELLKKYSGTPSPNQKAPDASDRKKSPKQGDVNTPQNGRTTFIPPPTANIPNRRVTSPPTGQNQHPSPAQDSRPLSPIGQSPQWQQDQRFQGPTAEFAPNAFPSAPQYAPANDGPRWYDKFMDLLMGEDETLPGKRLALICSKCRLVNGLAPPGKQRLEDVGKWRCAACGTMNGEDSDMEKIMASIQKRDPAASPTQRRVEVQVDKPKEITENMDVDTPPEDEGEESDVTQYDTDEGDAVEDIKDEHPKTPAPAEVPRRRSNRVKAGQKKTNS